MVIDRTAELLSKAGLPSETAVTIIDNDISSPLLGDTNNAVGNSNTNELLKLLSDLGLVYCDIKEINKEIHSLHVMVNQHRKQEFHGQVSVVKKQLHGIRQGIEKIKFEYEDTTDPLLKHVVSTHQLSMSILSAESLTHLSELMMDAHDRHKQYIKKEILITSGYDNSISDEELEKLLEKPPAVFTENLLQETNLAKQTLNEIQERHDEFVKLEGTILELNTMFQDESRGRGI